MRTTMGAREKTRKGNGSGHGTRERTGNGNKKGDHEMIEQGMVELGMIDGYSCSINK